MIDISAAAPRRFDQLFLDTLEDLESRVAVGTRATPYSQFMAAILLRKLLLDGRPLMDVVNAEHHLRITLPINHQDPPTEVAMWSIQDGLDPDTADHAGVDRVEVTRSAFLRRPVILTDGAAGAGLVICTVRHVIRYVSHVAGAVHVGQPADDPERVLAWLATELQTGFDIAIPSLRPIGRVTLAGLAPLREAAREAVESAR